MADATVTRALAAALTGAVILLATLGWAWVFGLVAGRLLGLNRSRGRR